MPGHPADQPVCFLFHRAAVARYTVAQGGPSAVVEMADRDIRNVLRLPWAHEHIVPSALHEMAPGRLATLAAMPGRPPPRLELNPWSNTPPGVQSSESSPPRRHATRRIQGSRRLWVGRRSGRAPGYIVSDGIRASTHPAVPLFRTTGDTTDKLGILSSRAARCTQFSSDCSDCTYTLNGPYSRWSGRPWQVSPLRRRCQQRLSSVNGSGSLHPFTSANPAADSSACRLARV